MIKNKQKTVLKIDDSSSNKKVYFGDEGQVVDEPVDRPKQTKIVVAEEKVNDGEGFKKRHQQNGKDLERKWYQTYEQHNTSEFKDIKDSELRALQSICKNAFLEEIQALQKSEFVYCQHPWSNKLSI